MEIIFAKNLSTSNTEMKRGGFWLVLVSWQGAWTKMAKKQYGLLTYSLILFDFYQYVLERLMELS